MNSLEYLDAQLKELLLLNGGDLNIEEYPEIIKEAAALDVSQAELARRIGKVINTIDWTPYNRIDEQLKEIKVQLKGSIFKDEAETIVSAVEHDLLRPKAINYILSVVKKWGLTTRERNSFEADSFDNLWMTDEAWNKYQKEQIVVEWLGEKARSLADLGDISYRKREEAKYYLRNTTFLIPQVTFLTKSTTKANEFSQIIETEPNIEKRYLRIIYKLNSALPFYIKNESFDLIEQLFAATATNYNLYIETADAYAKGYLHIWTEETDYINKSKLTPGYDYNSFLTFLYSVKPNHPFYLNAVPFPSPENMMQLALLEDSQWLYIAEAIENEQLIIWLAGVGKEVWVNQYKTIVTRFINSEYYTNEDKKLVTVQTLIQIINPAAGTPQIFSDKQQITMLTIEGSNTVQQPIILQLKNAGFVKAKVYFDTQIDGISINTNTITLFSQGKKNSEQILLTIVALQLVKDKVYDLKIHVQTEYETLSIPGKLKVVFPKKAYFLHLLKYAVFGGTFFGIVRFLLGAVTKNDTWLSTINYQYPNAYSSYLPPNYFSYFIAVLIIVVVMIGSVFFIKKREKI